jgi:integrase
MLRELAKIDAGTWRALPKNIRVDIAIQRCDDYAKKHNRSYKTYVKPNLEFWKDKLGKDTLLADITTVMLTDIQLEMVDTVKPSTIDKRFAVLKTVFNRCIKWGLCAENPVTNVEFFNPANGRLRYLHPEDEAPAFFNAVRQGPDYLFPLAVVAIYTGLRKGNLLDLRRSQIDFNANVISVERTKSNRPLVVPMNKTVRTVLSDWLNVVDEKVGETEYVFVHTGKRHTAKPLQDIKKAFAAALTRAGIVDLRWHDLRHSYGSWLALAGVDLLTIKELMGHETVTQTLRYAHLNRKHRKTAVQALDGFVPILCLSAATSQDKEEQDEAEENEDDAA